MAKVDSILEQRLKKKENSSKMSEMALQTVQGNLSSFSGIFCVNELSSNEKAFIENLLNTFSKDNHTIEGDLHNLVAITSEVKAINNQAAILHGERIKKAHDILTKYKEGAFTAWLMAAYGNRQTPYNFMHYFEFYEELPKLLRAKLESMPRQAVYTLASRQGPLVEKQRIVENYNGENKTQLLEIIREVFPLETQDKRASNPCFFILNTLSKLELDLKKRKQILSDEELLSIKESLYKLVNLLNNL